MNKNFEFPEITAGAFILNKKGEILLIKSPKWKGKFCVCGGHVNYGEKAEDALKREVKEEVNLEIEKIKLLTVQECIFDKNFHRQAHFIFLEFFCFTKDPKQIKIDNREITGYIWIKPKDALKLDLEKYTKRVIKKFLLTKKSKK